MESENKDLMGETVEESEGGTAHSALLEETTAVCPPESSCPSATDNKENSEKDQNDHKIKVKGTFNPTLQEDQPSTELGTNTYTNVAADATKQDQTCMSMEQVDILVMCAADSLMQHALVPNEVPSAEIPDVFKSKTKQESQQLTFTPPVINLETDLRLKDEIGNTERSPQCSGQGTFSLNYTEPLISDSFNHLNNSLITQQDNIEQLQEDTTSIIGTDGNKEICATSLVESPLMKPDNFPLSTEHLAAQSEAFNIINNAQEQEKHCENICVTPKNMVTMILNVEPQDMQKNENVGPDVLRCSQEAELCNADLTKVSSMDCNEKKSEVPSTLTNLNKLDLAAQSEIFEAATDVEENECEDSSVRPKKVFTIVLELKPQDMQQGENVGASTSDLISCSERAELSNEKVTESCTENPEARELMHNELLNSSKSCHTVSECQLSGSNATETTFPDVKQEEVTDFCHHEEQTISSVSCTVEGSVQTGNALTETPIFVGDSKPKMARSSVQSTGTRHAEMAEETSELEDPKPGHLEVPERRVDLLLKEESESKFPSSLADTGVSQRQVNVNGFSVF